MALLVTMVRSSNANALGSVCVELITTTWPNIAVVEEEQRLQPDISDHVCPLWTIFLHISCTCRAIFVSCSAYNNCPISASYSWSQPGLFGLSPKSCSLDDEMGTGPCPHSERGLNRSTDAGCRQCLTSLRRNLHQRIWTMP